MECDASLDSIKSSKQTPVQPLSMTNIDFILLVKILLEDGTVLPMLDLHTTPMNNQRTNGIDSFSCDHRRVRNMIETFAKVISHNESESQVFLKTLKEVAMEEALYKTAEDDTLLLFRCAEILWKRISENKPLELKGTLSNGDAQEHVSHGL